MRNVIRLPGLSLDLTIEGMASADQEFQGEGTWNFNRAQLRRCIPAEASIVQTNGMGEETITKLWEFLETEVFCPLIPEDPDIAGGMVTSSNFSRYISGIDEDDDVTVTAGDEAIAIFAYLFSAETIEVSFYGMPFWAFHDLQHALDASLDDDGVRIEVSAYNEDRCHTLGSMMGMHHGFVTPYDCIRAIVGNEKAFEDRFNTPSIALKDLCGLLKMEI